MRHPFSVRSPLQATNLSHEAADSDGQAAEMALSLTRMSRPSSNYTTEPGRDRHRLHRSCKFTPLLVVATFWAMSELHARVRMQSGGDSSDIRRCGSGAAAEAS